MKHIHQLPSVFDSMLKQDPHRQWISDAQLLFNKKQNLKKCWHTPDLHHTPKPALHHANIKTQQCILVNVAPSAVINCYCQELKYKNNMTQHLAGLLRLGTVCSIWHKAGRTSTLSTPSITGLYCSSLFCCFNTTRLSCISYSLTHPQQAPTHLNALTRVCVAFHRLISLRLAN